MHLKMEPSKLHKSTAIAQSTDAVGPILPVKINVESCPVTAVRHSRPLCHMKHSTKLQSEPGQCVRTFTQVYVLSIEEPEKAGPMESNSASVSTLTLKQAGIKFCLKC